jgi:hypothetical protein
VARLHVRETRGCLPDDAALLVYIVEVATYPWMRKDDFEKIVLVLCGIVASVAKTGITDRQVAWFLVDDPRRPVNIDDTQTEEELGLDMSLDLSNHRVDETTDIFEIKNLSIDYDVVSTEVQGSEAKRPFLGGGEAI